MIEEYAQGRSRLWYWQQVINVLFVSLVCKVHDKVPAGIFFMGYVCCEFAVVMGAIGIAGSWRHTHSVKETLSLPIICTFLFLAAVAWFGYRLMRWAHRFRQSSQEPTH